MCSSDLVRVEVRGSLGRERRTEVAGVAERVGIIAGAVAASAASVVVSWRPGAIVLGQNDLPNREILDDVIRRGVPVLEYVGSGG